MLFEILVVNEMHHHFCAYYISSIVGEEGASIYSVSEEAEKEMPNLDVNLRSAGITVLN